MLPHHMLCKFSPILISPTSIMLCLTVQLEFKNTNMALLKGFLSLTMGTDR